jgi:hypothetical protein
VHLGLVHRRTRPARPNGPTPSAILAHPGKQGRGFLPQRRRLAGEIRPTDSEIGGGGGSGRLPTGWTLELSRRGGGRLTVSSSPRRRAWAGVGRRCWAAQAIKNLGWQFGEQHNPCAQLGEVTADQLRLGGTLSTTRHRRGGRWSASACFGQLFAVAVGDGGLTAAASQNGAGVERWAGVVDAEAERRSRQVKTETERRQAGK